MPDTITAVVIRPGEPATLVNIPPGGVYTYLRQTFPDSFDGIHLGPDVIGYVGDIMLLDGSLPNPVAKALADAVYAKHADRLYHTAVNGPMVVLGLLEHGAAATVPAEFVTEFLPTLAGAR